jgi:hypothetical protein
VIARQDKTGCENILIFITTWDIPGRLPTDGAGVLAIAHWWMYY